MALAQPRERGVLFQPDMVRAVLRAENPKRQTRRLHRLGDVGDVLWAREAWRAEWFYNGVKPSNIPEKSPVVYEADEHVNLFGYEKHGVIGKLRPSMFMCRWMSRIDLKLVDVREEPLQDISEADAIAEGVIGLYAHASTNPVGAFRALWESINGADSWAANPTVFAHTFERVK